MHSVASDYELIDETGTAVSVGSHSREWINATFDTEKDISNVVAVAANAHSDEHLPKEQLRVVDEMWKYAASDSHAGTRPRPVTDRAISHAREQPGSRLLVHYMQPHVPLIGAEEIDEEFIEAGDPDENVWASVQRGDISEDTSWRRYKATLELVLDDVALLLSNVDAERVLITSEETYYGRLSSHPSDIPSGTVAIYVLDSDGYVYKKPIGGSASQIGGGGGGSSPDETASATGATSVTINFSSAFDLWRLDVAVTETTGNTSVLKGYANGTESGYNNQFADGASASGRPRIDALAQLEANDTMHFDFTLAGRWGVNFQFTGPTATGGIARVCTVSTNSGLTSPIDLFTIINQNGNACDWEIRHTGGTSHDETAIQSDERHDGNVARSR